MQQLLLIFLGFFITINVKSQTCNELPIKFYTYGQAIKSIKSSSFKVIDQLPYGKSSWIKRANYYSCDGMYGYLIYATDKGKEFIHSSVPVGIWRAFKSSYSSGSYYMQNIKGRYKFVPG